MADFGSVVQGFIIMIVFNLIALFFVFQGGLMMDTMHDKFTDLGLYNVPPDWDSSGQSFALINLFYMFCMALSPIGVGVFILTLIRYQQYDEYNQYGGYQ